MIEYIQGTIDECAPATITINAGHIGYLLNITLSTYKFLEGKRDVRLWVHEIVREDVWTLYGFATREERECFRMLLGVNGIGAGTARIILSSLTTAEFKNIIISNDSDRLKLIKGIGMKTAQRIIVDLRDKIGRDGADDSYATAAEILSNSCKETYEGALNALVMLGFSKQASQKVLNLIFDKLPDIKLEDAIKRALALL